MRTGTKGILFLLPTLIFLAAAVGFYLGLDPERDPKAIPSPLIDKPAPALSLPAVPGLGLPGLEAADLKGAPVTAVNLWATWCGPCRIEHPQLMALSKVPGVRLVGIDYKDKAASAVAFLEERGNPFAAVGFDEAGRAGIDWGITGVPETFFLDREGRIRFRFSGPIDAETLEKVILPRVKEIGG